MVMKHYIQYDPDTGEFLNHIKVDSAIVSDAIKNAPNTIVLDEGPYISSEFHRINTDTMELESKPPVEKSDLQVLAVEIAADPVKFLKEFKESPETFTEKINKIELSPEEQIEYSEKDLKISKLSLTN